MSLSPKQRSRPTSLGLIGYGAFGRLLASHVAPHITVRVFDSNYPLLSGGEAEPGERVTLEQAASCDVVVLAVPVAALEEAVDKIAPHLRAGAMVIDVGSVKILPSEIMERRLPEYVGIVGTHPLFGPQSAAAGLVGLKIAICPVRGKGAGLIGAFCRKFLGLKVIFTTAEEHDREAAMVQGLTHLIAKVLVEMEPLPRLMTTRSFELLMQGVEMVRYDAPEVFDAIERLNPHAQTVRRRFFDLAAALDEEMSRRF